ncbi:MAG: hypothetical protein EFT35_09200 [Methanophagales archaeon ANME-1-THS]|nr:MAG: hypothetical protein EFT35_09200 [Methanophagales archaeon ANME-1-THS]
MVAKGHGEEERIKSGASISKILIKNISNILSRIERFFLLFLCFMIFLAFIAPIAVHPRPFGTDIYSHLIHTKEMTETNSLSDFYELLSEKTIVEKEYSAAGYPFGVWLFGSIVAKVTGVNPTILVSIIPIMFLFTIIVVFYFYANMFLKSKKYSMLAVIFLLSMPQTSMAFLRYVPSVFVTAFVLFIFYFTMDRKIISVKRFFLMSIFVICLCITHTGTYMFLFYFAIGYLTIYSIYFGELHKNIYILIVCMLINYAIMVDLFSNIQYQYIQKSELLLSVGDFISTKLNIPFVNELFGMFRHQIFVNNSLYNAAIWAGFIYAICKLLCFLRSKFPEFKIFKRETVGLTIPIIGRVERVSHSVLATPFWIGPLQTFFSVFGIHKLDRTAKCMFLTVMTITLLPGSLYKGPTGATREIYYFFIIIPIVAVFGFYYLTAKIEKFFKNNKQKIVISIALFLIFSVIIVLPIIANVYYNPKVSGKDNEINGMRWLGTVGNPWEICSGVGYRQIELYTNKGILPESLGGATKSFWRDLSNTYLSRNSEQYVDDLYSTFNVKYLIASEKVILELKGRGSNGRLQIDTNNQLDKIYSTNENFSIYSYINPVVSSVSNTSEVISIEYKELNPLFLDTGAFFLIDTDTYKMQIGKTSPKIRYIGNNTVNLLYDGYLMDIIYLSWSGGAYDGKKASYILDELPYKSIYSYIIQIVYKTILQNENETENWATLIVQYTFYQKAMKREIIVANDFQSFASQSSLDMKIITKLVSPMPYFHFQEGDNTPTNRTIYPSEDSIIIKDIKFDKIYFSDGDNGIYYKYDKAYPDEILYKGSTKNDYSAKNVGIIIGILPSTSFHMSQYISIGDKKTAEENINRYDFVSLYPYPNGELPIVLTSYMDTLNTTSEEAFNYRLNAHDKLQNIGITNYTEGVNMKIAEINTARMNKLMEEGINIVGYEDVYYNRSFDDLEVQRNKIQIMTENAEVYYNITLTGFIPQWREYNLDTVKALNARNILFALMTHIRPQTEESYQEGLRQPQLAYYNGNKTGLVLLTISEPTDSYLRQDYEVEDVVSTWKTLIDLTVANDDLCLFLWRSEKVGMPEYIDELVNVSKYAQSKGMTFTTPYEIAKHFKLLQNVSALVSKDENEVLILVKNSNNEPINGVTFVVEMPRIHGVSYTCKNGQIVRKVDSFSTCILGISTDLNGGETKDITINTQKL